MKVAHVTTIDLSLRSLMLNQLVSLRGAGYEVCGISTPGEHVPAIEAAGIRHIAVPMSRNLTPFADLVSLWKLYRVMRRERFTIVHTHTPKAGLLGQLAARLAGVPIVVNTVHGFYFHDHMSAQARRFYIAMEKVAAWCSDLILSQNAEDIQTALREGICRSDRIKLLGNGIDLTQFDANRFSTAEVLACRKRMGIHDTVPVIGFVGRLAARRKGFLDYLAAARELSKRLPEARFLIIGDADHGKPDAVEPSVAADYGIADRCVFLGNRPNTELPLLYKTMNVLVLPSLFEGVPRVVMEASAMGTPCVVSDVKGNREAVVNGRNGMLVPLGDVPALTAAIERILTEPGTARRMSQEAQKIAAERFDERPIFEMVKREYEQLIRAADLRGLRLSKRLFDVVVAGTALLLLSPVLVIIALLVRVKLGSPIIFHQQRPGLYGRPFLIWKFRTMTDARDESGELLPDEERMSRFGMFLRNSSLDELPELWNVLKGEMSLVGPRPLLMRYLPRYSPEQMRRHDARPGITGLAQVNGRNALSWERKFELDVRYVDNQSLALDLRILLQTVRKVFAREGLSAEGHFSSPEFMGNTTASARTTEEVCTDAR